MNTAVDGDGYTLSIRPKDARELAARLVEALRN
jgi:hypothetical protein